MIMIGCLSAAEWYMEESHISGEINMYLKGPVSDISLKE